MSEWTDKKIEKLIELWNKEISTAEIGKKLGFSKNAIVGKVHRLGLPNRVSPIKKSTKSENLTTIEKENKKTINKEEKVSEVKKNKIEKKVETKKIKVVENEDLKQKDLKNKSEKGNGVTLLELNFDSCKWPLEDSSDELHFCGKKVYKNKSYCLEHCKVAYTLPSIEEKKEFE